MRYWRLGVGAICSTRGVWARPALAKVGAQDLLWQGCVGKTGFYGYMHVFVLMNAEYNHETAKKNIFDGYGNIGYETLYQFVVFILEINHNYYWRMAPVMLGGKSIWQDSVNETFGAAGV